MGYSIGQLSCGEKCLKYVIFAFNFVFWVAGAAILGVGIWLKVDPRIFQLLQIASTANGNHLISAAAIVLIVVGALMFVIGGLGCCGAIQESVWMLTAYSVLLCLLIILQITAGILAAVFRHKIMGSLKTDMLNTVQTRYNEKAGQKKDAITIAYDFLQAKFKCCGVSDYKDWRNSSWINSNPNNYSVPLTCCVLSNDDHQNPQPKDTTQCQADAQTDKTANTQYLYATGCYTTFSDFIVKYGAVIIGVAFGFVALQVLGVILVCCLRTAIKNAGDYA